MSDQASPYQVPQSGMSPVTMPDLPPAAPTVIPKVFGIIHICYAVLGGLGALASVVSMMVLRQLANGGGEFETLQPMLDAMVEMETYMYCDMAVKLILAMMLLVAGIGLLKRRRWSLKLSVGWAVARVVAAVGMMVWGLQVTARFQEQLVGTQDAQEVQIQQISQGVGNVLGIVFVCVYPVVTLIFLSKKKVKDAMVDAV